MLFEAFKQGINLGGFLSQYELIADADSWNSLKEHFGTYGISCIKCIHPPDGTFFRRVPRI